MSQLLTFPDSVPVSSARNSVAELSLRALPFLACLGSISLGEVDGFAMSGWIWVVSALFITIAWLLDSEIPATKLRLSPWIYFVPWIGVMSLSITWSDGSFRRSLQDFVQLSVPIWIGFVASRVITTREQLQRLVHSTFFAVAFHMLGFFYNLLTAGEENAAYRVGSLTALFFALFALGFWQSKKRLATSIWFVSVLFAVMSGSRTVALLMMGLPIFHPLLAHLKVRIGLVAVVCLMAWFAMTIPSFRNRFIHEDMDWDTDSVSALNSSGRFEAWPLIWERGLERPLFGWGVGSAQKYVDEISSLGGHPHNDYLRVFYETGFIGSVFFLFAFGSLTISLLTRIRSEDELLRLARSGCFLGLLGLGASSLTDNTLIYALAYTNPLFALIGATYGCRARCDAVSPLPELRLTDLPELPRLRV